MMDTLLPATERISIGATAGTSADAQTGTDENAVIGTGVSGVAGAKGIGGAGAPAMTEGEAVAGVGIVGRTEGITVPEGVAVTKGKIKGETVAGAEAATEMAVELAER